MKPLFTATLLFFMLLFSTRLFAQCPTGTDPIVLHGQEEVDDFVLHHSDCDTIPGRLRIFSSNSRKVSDLSGLSFIKVVEGNLEVVDCDLLSNLQGLNNLEKIGDTLLLRNNDNLESLDGLDELRVISNGLYIEWNRSLRTVEFQHEIDLSSGPIFLYWNTALESMAALRNLSSLDGDLRIAGAVINDLFDLSNLRSVHGNVFIEACDNLTSLDGLENLSEVSGQLTVRKNQNISNIRSLSNITSLESLFVGQNTNLADLTGLHNIEYIRGGLYINRNGIVNLEGLNSLKQIGSLRIQYSHNLRDFSGLDSLRIIDGFFYIENNSRIRNFEGLNGLAFICGDVRIIGNDSLLNFAGLEELRACRWQFYLAGNNSLYSLEGLNCSFLEGEGCFVVIFDNPQLEICNTERFCEFQESDSWLSIHDNGENCSVEGMVACDDPIPVTHEHTPLPFSCDSLLSPSENPEEAADWAFSIAPNPARDKIFILFENDIMLFNATIFNQFGQVVLKQEKSNVKELDVSRLGSGMYWIVIEELTTRARVVRKIILW